MLLQHEDKKKQAEITEKISRLEEQIAAGEVTAAMLGFYNNYPRKMYCLARGIRFDLYRKGLPEFDGKPLLYPIISSLRVHD